MPNRPDVELCACRCPARHAISAEETALKTIKLAVQEIWFTKSYTAVQSVSSVPLWVYNDNGIGF